MMDVAERLHEKLWPNVSLDQPIFDRTTRVRSQKHEIMPTRVCAQKHEVKPTR